MDIENGTLCLEVPGSSGQVSKPDGIRDGFDAMISSCMRLVEWHAPHTYGARFGVSLDSPMMVNSTPMFVELAEQVPCDRRLASVKRVLRAIRGKPPKPRLRPRMCMQRDTAVSHHDGLLRLPATEKLIEAAPTWEETEVECSVLGNRARRIA